MTVGAACRSRHVAVRAELRSLVGIRRCESRRTTPNEDQRERRTSAPAILARWCDVKRGSWKRTPSFAMTKHRWIRARRTRDDPRAPGSRYCLLRHDLDALRACTARTTWCRRTASGSSRCPSWRACRTWLTARAASSSSAPATSTYLALPGTRTWRVTCATGRHAFGSAQLTRRASPSVRARAEAALVLIARVVALSRRAPAPSTTALPAMRPAFMTMPILPWPRSLPKYPPQHSPAAYRRSIFSCWSIGTTSGPRCAARLTTWPLAVDGDTAHLVVGEELRLDGPERPGRVDLDLHVSGGPTEVGVSMRRRVDVSRCTWRRPRRGCRR